MRSAEHDPEPSRPGWLETAGGRSLVLVGVALVAVALGAWVIVSVLRDDDGATPASAPAEPVAAPAEPPAAAGEPVAELPSGPLPERVPGEAVLVTDGPAVDKVALTFDDGLCTECVQAMLELLAETGTPATMFPNGIYAENWEGSIPLIHELVAQGQIEFGNHSFGHGDLRELKRKDLSRDLRQNEKWIWDTFRSDPRPLLRPPFGAYNDKVIRVAGNQGYTQVVTWSSSGLDWEQSDPAAIAQTVRDTLKPGAIVLLHPNTSATIEALPTILEDIRARGLEPVLLSELLAEQ